MKLKILIPSLAIAAAFGCAPKDTKTVLPATESTSVSRGTEIHAILLKELTSGGSSEGEDVPMMVSEDVRDAKGHVVVAKGTPLMGKITWSRAEGSLGSLTNQPARLNFKFDIVDAVDGTDLKLSAAESEVKDYELNRDNTGRIEPSASLEKLSADAPNEEVLQAVRDLFDKGDASKLDSPESRERFAAIAQEMRLDSTSRLIQKNEVSKVNDLVKQLRSGGSIAAIASGGSLGLVDAAIELAGVAGQVGSRLGKMLGGRNIKAYIGTPVKGYVVETVEVKVTQ